MIVTHQESGDVTPSFISYSLEKMNENHDLAYQEEVIKGAAGTMYAGTYSRTVYSCRFSTN
jgi:hypothetical protein